MVDIIPHFPLPTSKNKNAPPLHPILKVLSCNHRHKRNKSGRDLVGPGQSGGGSSPPPPNFVHHFWKPPGHHWGQKERQACTASMANGHQKTNNSPPPWGGQKFKIYKTPRGFLLVGGGGGLPSFYRFGRGIRVRGRVPELLQQLGFHYHLRVH